ncbi:MAG: hemin ABC transporter substrate-binding protein [Dehalococcoidia bacterium]
MATRMLVGLTLIAALLTFAACGEEAASTETATAPASASTSAASAAPTTTREATPVLPVTVDDKDGKPVTIRDVSRVVILNGDITEVVYALGLGEQVVGVDTSATYPPEARAKQSIGYQARLNAEGVLALTPTLVIGDEGAGPPEVIEQIRSTGVPVLIIPDAATIDDISTKITAVATALGVPGRGAELASQTRRDIDSATDLVQRATSKPTVSFLYLRGSATQMMGGKGTRADSLIEAAGGVDAGVRAGIVDYKPITPEALVTASPDVILVMDAGLESVGGVDGLLAIPGMAETPAGKARRVVHFDDQYLLGFGPRTGQLLMELVRALHPELAQTN